MANPGSIGSAMPASEDTQLRKFADLERFVRELTPSIARSFAPVFEAINAQIAQMNAIQVEQAAQLVSLNAAIALQVQPSSGHTGVASGSLSSSPGEIARTTFTVPTGFTRAQVFGTAFVSFYNPGASADNVRLYLDINGAYSGTPEVNSITSIGTTAIGSAYAATLSGLTGGATFYVRAVVYNQTGNATQFNAANVDATVLFLR